MKRKEVKFSVENYKKAKEGCGKVITCVDKFYEEVRKAYFEELEAFTSLCESVLTEDGEYAIDFDWNEEGDKEYYTTEEDCGEIVGTSVTEVKVEISDGKVKDIRVYSDYSIASYVYWSKIDMINVLELAAKALINRMETLEEDC